ncbi:MAG TPA: Eco57I restriction-modification methylase domain-containing protein [Anaerolineae bacterium]|nr:Eco57I restriction-modification methylase domain-containing protein [Anaerolineae bacterium]HQI84138.1 Eco57I restriction-modification methylase domain-containing protein [Anaerolineae bacterium]
MNKIQSLQAIQVLVNRFNQNRDTYVRSGSDYNETQLRTDFLNPFLAALGWDVFNEKQAPQYLREVVHEDTVEVTDDGEVFAKKPDYALRLGAIRKFFVEAKRPSMAIVASSVAAFQVRRYGWNAHLPISILTNFDQLAIYDCRVRPQAADDAHVARLKVYDYTEYVTKFDEIYAQLSREAVYTGSFDAQFSIEQERFGTESFDAYFLNQIEAWRLQLAQDIVQQNLTLTEAEVNFLVQRLLNRIIFLRICEDRELERYQALQSVQTYDDLKALFHQADRRYNSGLFDFIEDQLSLNIIVSSGVLIAVFRELYYPASPYAFSVVEAGILGEIYERFLGKHIAVVDRQVSIVDKDEVAASQGVVPTPQYIVDAIVEKTLSPLCIGKSPTELARLCLADIACGSGAFLVAAYQYLLNAYLESYLQERVDRYRDRIYEGAHHTWHLTLAERQRILCMHIFGVDIDPQAVEITRFSLLLKVLEDVPATAITAHWQAQHTRALPDLRANIQYGNSLVDSAYFDYDQGALRDTVHYAQLNPLDWAIAFPPVFTSGGFDALIGNPPYIRIQNMVRYSPREVQYYQSDVSPYTCAQSDNFDKYALFIERGLSLLKPTGRLGYIVPHKFFSLKSGQALRKLLSEGQHVAEIVHFGVQQVFGQRRTTYTCILTLSGAAMPHFTVEHVSDLSAWQRGEAGEIVEYQADYLTEAPWEFVSPAARQVFERLRAEYPTTLEHVADIFVGVQTSADKLYIVTPVAETATDVTFVDVAGTTWTIEKAIARPCLKDVALPAYSRPQPNTYIIFPYTIGEGGARLYTLKEMQERFPQCWAYLNTHQDSLSQRSVQGRTPETWYRYGRSQSLTKFGGAPKLIWPVLSVESRYAYDDQDIVFTGGGNGPYYGLCPRPDTELSIHYLQAVLSHPVVEAMVRAIGSSFRGGYRSHGKQFVKDLPIRQIDFANIDERAIHDGIVDLVKALIQATERAATATIPTQRQQAEQQAHRLRQAVERKISDLYHITAMDLAAVGAILEGE